MKRTSAAIVAASLTLALSACGDDTAKSNTPFTESDVGADASTTDTGTSDSGGATDTGGGGDDTGSPDMGVDMAIDPTLCGNGMLDGAEVCDDGNDDDTDLCNSNCTLTCGDGVLAGTEACDTAIPAGMPGACPTACDDGNACTTDSLQGTGCEVQCVTGVIGVCADGDGCCPSACDANSDNDCSSICGNGQVEGNETCDGDCPTVCDDGVFCTNDVMTGDPATCNVMCSTSAVTLCVDDDGCCPTACDSTNDNDCSATCGNNMLEAPELCDGDCPMAPADCDDANMCTNDYVSGDAGQCNAQCVNAPLGCVAAMMDGCCPSNCDASNDGDCTDVCGDGVVEAGEQCDDGNTMNGDGCDANCDLESGVIAFRMSDLDLRDPHIYVAASFFGCRDLTDMPAPLNLSPSINQLIEDQITLDDDGDGLLDLSFVTLFTPLDQTDGGGGSVTIAEADCTAPIDTTTCVVDSQGSTYETANYTSSTTTDCLGILPNTARPYTPAIGVSTPSCFSTSAVDLTINVGGILVPLSNVTLGATYTGNPATAFGNGLLRGFISEADADSITLPANIPLVGGDPLSSVLPGGTDNCAPHDDRDVGPDGITMGWWFYLNFPADSVSVTVQ